MSESATRGTLAVREGHVFKDTYRLKRRLSGSKVSYLVEHLGLKTPFVVELYADLRGVDEMEYEQRTELKREFSHRQGALKAMASVNLPGLATVVDSFEEEGLFYYVRDWIEGLTLRRLLEQSLKPLDQKTSENFVSQLFSLVEALNSSENPYTLGTICSDYIVADPNGHLTVVDYGIAEHRDGKADFEAFSCPEFIGGGEVDQRADLYSIGAVLYFILTGSELPPIWDRITYQASIPAPVEFDINVEGRIWVTLEAMLSLNVNERPGDVEQARTLLASAEFKETPESSPGTWYPEQDNLWLADSYPFAPFETADWILKMVQAAVVGRARGLHLVQSREACTLDFQFAAPDVPTPRHVLEALTGDSPVTDPKVAELACGLRMVGEFRDFRVRLDDWKRSWTLRCRGGQISTQAGKSFGRSGIEVKVKYAGRGQDRAAASADEMLKLVRRTRLCTVPISIGRKKLEPGRGVAISELPKDVVELYLASASLPQDGPAELVDVPEKRRKDDMPLTAYGPGEGNDPYCHIDMRCLVAPGEGKVAEVFHAGYHYLRRPSRVLWYRRGVLCGEQFLEKRLPLQLDIHLNGDHLEYSSSGLELVLPNWLQASRLKPILELSKLLPVTRMKLAEFWEENPGEAAPKTQAFAGMLGAPLLLFFVANKFAPGVFLLKKAAFAALGKGSAAAGGVLGYKTANDHIDAVRATVLKAIDAYQKEEF